MISHNLGCWAVRVGDGPCNACATNASALCGSAAATTTMHHIAPLAWPCSWQRLWLRCRACWMARWHSCRPTTPGWTATTPDWHTLGTHKLSQNRKGRGCWDWRINQWLTLRHRTFWGKKPIKHFATECIWLVKKTKRVFFKCQLCLRFGGTWERGWFWVGRGPQPTGQREWGGLGIACLRFPPFWLLRGYRCAAPALLQTHSALSASSSERCNSK